MEELLTLPGVGRKTANLVLILAHRSAGQHLRGYARPPDLEPAGMGATRTPDETEQALYAATERKWWPVINLYLVTWGQNVCRPVYPVCGSLRAGGPVPENRRRKREKMRGGAG
jgi:endonuclease III